MSAQSKNSLCSSWRNSNDQVQLKCKRLQAVRIHLSRISQKSPWINCPLRSFQFAHSLILRFIEAPVYCPVFSSASKMATEGVTEADRVANRGELRYIQPFHTLQWVSLHKSSLGLVLFKCCCQGNCLLVIVKADSSYMKLRPLCSKNKMISMIRAQSLFYTEQELGVCVTKWETPAKWFLSRKK